MSEFLVSVGIGGFAAVLPDAGAVASRRTARRRTLRANAERLVNYYWKGTEPGQEKGGQYLEQVPGLTLLSKFPGTVRGMWWTGSRLFVVAGAVLYEVFSDNTRRALGAMNTNAGPVDFAQGVFQLVLVDGSSGYVLTLASNVFGRITDEDFYGADRVGFLDGKFVFARPGTQQFYWSEGIDNASSYDALDFASAESAPDKIVALLIDHRELWMFGEYTTEVWFSSPGGDQVYVRNNGASIEFGCIATHSARQLDNSVFWLAGDKNGSGVVMMAGGPNGYQPVRVSTQEVEEAIALSDDMTGARAFAYQMDGQSFYVLQVPGVETTWVYEVATRKWHERAEIDLFGDLQPWRAVCYAFAFGKRLVGDDAGKMYELDPWENANAGDTLYREWTSPQQGAADRKRRFYDELRLDASYGQTLSGLAPSIELSYSNDGGETWSAWQPRSLGALGQYGKQAKWTRQGVGRDRVWRFRCTDNAKASIIGYSVQSRKATT